MTRKILIICVLCTLSAPIFLFMAAIIPTAHAAQTENYVPLAPIDVPGSEFTSTGPTSECRAPTCFPRYLRTIYNVGIVLAGLFAVVSIVRGGFELMFTDSILGHSEGKGIILRALGGLVIVYSSYILMNAINPGLGRDLDLALQFPHITLLREASTLSVVGLDNLTQYQLDLLSKAEVNNAEWRAGEKTRLEGEIRQLERALEEARQRGDTGEIATAQWNLDSKKADLATLEREGVVQAVERNAQRTFQETTTQEQLDTLIENITKKENGLTSVQQAFDTMINNTPLTPKQKAYARAMEASRVASIEQSLALGILEHPPRGFVITQADWETYSQKILDRMTAVDAERIRVLEKLAALKTDNASDFEVVSEIEGREKIVWAQTCNTIASINYECVQKGLGIGCPKISDDIRTRCVANGGTKF